MSCDAPYTAALPRSAGRTDRHGYVPANAWLETPAGSQLVHDDRLISAALIAEVDRLYHQGAITMGGRRLRGDTGGGSIGQPGILAGRRVRRASWRLAMWSQGAVNGEGRAVFGDGCFRLPGFEVETGKKWSTMVVGRWAQPLESTSLNRIQ